VFEQEIPEEADVVIIGAGVIGCSIARELSRYELKTIVIEKESDVGWVTTKGNMGIIHGFVPKMGVLKGKMCIEGNRQFDKIAEELDVPFKRVGLLIVALSIIQFFALIIAYFLLKKRKIEVKWIWKRKLREMEPNISEKAKAALFVPSFGIIDPVQYTIALAENAIRNGVKIILNTKVIGFKIEENEIKEVITDKGRIKTRFVINAAGIYSDEIEALIGLKERKMWHGKGVMLVFDKILEGFYKHILAPMPIRVDPKTKGGAIGLTVHGRPIWGPNLVEARGKKDTSVLDEDIKMILQKFRELLREFPDNFIIKYYAGVRPVDEKSWDFVLGPTKVKGFINAAYILSPGLTAAPIIAKKIIEYLEKEGLELRLKENFDPYRKRIKSIREMDIEELDRAIKENPKYGRIICECEKISEAEIIEAIKRGARTIDSIKFRTLAGMGRCQGSRCLTKIMKILEKELQINPKEITVKGEGSNIFVGE